MKVLDLLTVIIIAWQAFGQTGNQSPEESNLKNGADDTAGEKAPLILLKELQLKSPLEKNSYLTRALSGVVR